MRAFRAEEHIADLNNIKKAYGTRTFSRDNLRDMLKNCNIPSNTIFVDTFIKSPAIKKLGRNQYTWAYQDPIHVNLLNIVYKEYKQLRDNYRKPKKSVPEPIKLISEEPKSDIQSAIDLLKANGYVILTPIATIYSKL